MTRPLRKRRGIFGFQCLLTRSKNVSTIRNSHRRNVFLKKTATGNDRVSQVFTINSTIRSRRQNHLVRTTMMTGIITDKTVCHHFTENGNTFWGSFKINKSFGVCNLTLNGISAFTHVRPNGRPLERISKWKHNNDRSRRKIGSSNGNRLRLFTRFHYLTRIPAATPRQRPLCHRNIFELRLRPVCSRIKSTTFQIFDSRSPRNRRLAYVTKMSVRRKSLNRVRHLILRRRLLAKKRRVTRKLNFSSVGRHLTRLRHLKGFLKQAKLVRRHRLVSRNFRFLKVVRIRNPTSSLCNTWGISNRKRYNSLRILGRRNETAPRRRTVNGFQRFRMKVCQDDGTAGLSPVFR